MRRSEGPVLHPRDDEEATMAERPTRTAFEGEAGVKMDSVRVVKDEGETKERRSTSLHFVRSFLWPHNI